MENTFSNVLPEDFSGTFYFTNPSDEDITCFWGKKGYTYPAMKTVPMVIVDATPLEIQSIRKKFAKELAEREFFKSEKYEALRSSEGDKDKNGVIHPLMGSFNQARQYSESDLTSYIQKCLDPLPLAKQVITQVVTEPIEEKLSRDEDGELNTQVAVKGKPLTLKNKER